MMGNDELICVDIDINDDEVVENRECFYVVISVSADDRAIVVGRGMARVCTNNDDGMFTVALHCKNIKVVVNHLGFSQLQQHYQTM